MQVEALTTLKSGHGCSETKKSTLRTMSSTVKTSLSILLRSTDLVTKPLTMESEKTNNMANKVRMHRKRFLDWLYSDSDDIAEVGRRVRDALEYTGKATFTIQGELDKCCAIPNYITENRDNPEDEDKHYNPEEIELI